MKSAGRTVVVSAEVLLLGILAGLGLGCSFDSDYASYAIVYGISEYYYYDDHYHNLLTSLPLTQQFMLRILLLRWRQQRQQRGRRP